MAGMRYVTLLLLTWASIGIATAANNLYRYTNTQGIVVIDDKIPPGYAAKGYEILSSKGRLLDTVEPSVLTDPEAVAEQEKILAAREKEDRFILTSYSSVEEIKAAMARKLEQLDREIQAIDINIKGTQKRIIGEQQRAANYQRGGRGVPENVTDTLIKLEKEIKKAESLLLHRREDYRKSEAVYLGYLSRFRELKGGPVPLSGE